MSRQLEQADGSCRDIAAAVLKGPAQATAVVVAADGLLASASVQLGDEADAAWRDWSRAAYPAVDREALDGFAARRSWR